ncbi:MAG: NAD(P)-binding domain-containing protein, partial [Flavobacteriaceae bacterium]|nr:NAD(P)-binding domain-containing protein [Flavobacteriaceae bacterium]
MSRRVIIVGGGAAGFFTAITIAEANPNIKVTILEKSSKILQKVKISGGGRCNVTHACFDPVDLVENYPRGRKELLGPFHEFMTGDTMEWFEDRGVALKIEEDNRVFPVSNSSDTIVNCLEESAKKANVELQLNQNVKKIFKIDDRFKITTDSQEFLADQIVIATGSSPKFW